MGHVLDGGYVDNSGSITTMEIASAVISAHVASEKRGIETYGSNYEARKIQPIFVEISNDSNTPCRLDNCEKGSSSILQAPFTGVCPAGARATHNEGKKQRFVVPILGEVVTPLFGVLSVRKRVGADAADQLAKFQGMLRCDEAMAQFLEEPHYLQFNLCDVEANDTPVGWMHTRAGADVYPRSLGNSPSEDLQSTRILETDSDCVNQNKSAFQSLLDLTRVD